MGSFPALEGLRKPQRESSHTGGTYGWDGGWVATYPLSTLLCDWSWGWDGDCEWDSELATVEVRYVVSRSPPEAVKIE